MSSTLQAFSVLILDYSHVDWLAFLHNPQVSPNEAITRVFTPTSLLS